MASPTRILFGHELIKLAEKYDFAVFNTDTKSSGLENFGDKYPERTFNFGISEQCMFAAASGFAADGEKVVVSAIGVFASMRASEQIRTFICYPNLNVTIISTHGGLLTGADGATHITSEDLGMMRAIPNLTIVEPSDLNSALRLAEKAIQFKGPLYIRFPKAPTPDIHPVDYDFEIGKGKIIYDGGDDATIFVIGWFLSKVLTAAEILKEKNIGVKVVEIHTLKPIDKDLIIETCKKVKKVVTVEDNNIIGGLGSAVCEVLSESEPKKVKRIGILDAFGESGDPEKQYEKNKMTVNDIVNAVLEM